MRQFAFAVTGLLAVASASRSDILPPGAKWINHVAKFENIADFPEYVFYAYPRDLDRRRPGNSSVRVTESGEVVISGFNPLAAGGGIFLFAVPKKLHGDSESPPAEEWFTGNVAGVLKSKPLAHAVRTANKSDPRDRIVTTYRIEFKDGLQLAEVTSEELKRTDERVSPASVVTEDAPRGPQWHWIIGGAATGAALVCACWLALRKKV